MFSIFTVHEIINKTAFVYELLIPFKMSFNIYSYICSCEKQANNWELLTKWYITKYVMQNIVSLSTDSQYYPQISLYVHIIK